MAEERRSTIAGTRVHETEVLRSRFRATAVRLADLDGLTELVRDMRRAHPDARHVCSAAVTGPHGEFSRSSDDGEPAGTAGAPILAAIHGRELTDVAVLVVRWFGGTLLGTGGLVRAYGGGAAAALDLAGVVRRLPGVELAARIPIDLAPRLEHAMRARGFVPSISYGADADVRVTVLASEADAVRSVFGDLQLPPPRATEHVIER